MDDSKELRAWREGEEIMDKIQKLHALFPRGSEDFFKANEIKTIAQLPHTNTQHHKTSALDSVAKRKEKSLGRITVRYRLCRVRPIDPDGVAGSTKDCTDGLCRCGLLPGDNPFQITLIVEQERVDHYHQERTEIEIEWP
jgi:hypothetical protein